MTDNTDDITLLNAQLRAELSGEHADGSKKPNEAQLNVWIPKPLLKRLKRHGADTGQTLKQMTAQALEAYLG